MSPIYEMNMLKHSIRKNEYFRFFFPLLWPKKDLKLQSLIIISFASVVLGLIVNLLIPIFGQRIVDELNSSSSKKEREEFSYNTLLTFVILKALQGVGTLSLLNCFQSYLWIRLEQNARKSVQIQFFEHLHNMSVQWQHNHKTSDIIGALYRGSTAVTSILEHSLYNIGPTIANVILAILYLSLKFNGQIGLIVFIQVGTYFYTTVLLTEWRSRYQRSLNYSEDEQKQQAMESLMNFETVKLFSNERFEKQKFAQCIERYHEREFKVLKSLSCLQLVQLGIVNVGLLIGSCIIVRMILNDEDITVGDYVLFASCMGQLILPLNYLGMHYRSLRRSIISLKSMMNILREAAPTERTKQKKLLEISSGEIEFRNVNFNHNLDNPVLQNISFTIPSKSTFALVGTSGSGKSSLVRLLTKLYEPNSGEIFISGESLSCVSPDSLRSQIGIVPQDTILFHDSIMNNIRYAKLDASDDEVMRASKCAQIHNAISKFPEGYNTMVGERGLKLSGGEKQRIAIARIFLRNPSPRIIILDEATSSLDARTEREIIDCFTKLCRNRTSLIVTHKLQTIQKVDQILVLTNGIIVERGSHKELIQLQGEYHSLWLQQDKNSLH